MSGCVLLVEDDPGIVDVVSFALTAEGFSMQTAATGAAALDLLNNDVDVVILDVMLPDLSGFEVCRRVRATSSVPIVMLTARDAELDKVMGLEIGADDYVTKPFSIAELTSRVRALLRRRQLDRADPDNVRREVGGLTIDLVRHQVTVDEKRVDLTPSEFQILALLSEAPGRVYSRHQIMECIWDVAFEGSQRACDYHIFNLRRKIERDPARPEFIVTVRGVGYRLEGGDPLVGSLPPDGQDSSTARDPPREWR